MNGLIGSLSSTIHGESGGRFVGWGWMVGEEEGCAWRVTDTRHVGVTHSDVGGLRNPAERCPSYGTDPIMGPKGCRIGSRMRIIVAVDAHKGVAARA